MSNETNNKNDRQGFLINMLMDGRSCLMVGGGRVAYRKIQSLLEAKATVSVISPDICEDLSVLVQDGLVSHTPRKFEESDVEGATVVFAATNYRPVNKEILEACRTRNIPCCCVDGNWAQGDFTTPAVARHNGLTLSVSSNGQNCRRSKMVKNSLARHLEMMDSARLVVVGTDHRHLNVSERESYHLSGKRFERAGFMLMQLWGVHEFMLLNTCNRIEVIAVVSKETSENGILRHALGFDRLKEDKFYVKHDFDAFKHLSFVTAGMLSQTPGETHIAAQMKEALSAARDKGWANNLLHEWLSAVQHVAKHIRTDICPKLHNFEIEDLAIKYLQNVEPDLGKKTILILGAGMVGRGLVKDSISKVNRIIWCYHVNRPDVKDSWKNDVELCTFNNIKDHITEADLIISATESVGHVLHQGHAPFFNQEKPLKIIDLGMPRNIDPELDDLSPDIEVVDLDGLKYWYRSELADMREILNHCNEVVHAHEAHYQKIVDSLQRN